MGKNKKKAKPAPAPAAVVETLETVVVTPEILAENPVLAEAGVDVGTVGEEVDSKVEVIVAYRDHSGQTVGRSFSKAVHGADFKKLADEFKATNAARIVA